MSEQTQWECAICGFIYDPALNDNIPFEQLPIDWRCPGCGYDKDVFRPKSD